MNFQEMIEISTGWQYCATKIVSNIAVLQEYIVSLRQEQNDVDLATAATTTTNNTSTSAPKVNGQVAAGGHSKYRAGASSV